MLPQGVVTGISLANNLVGWIGSLFGAAPRGDLQKFKRNAYPYMATCAKQTGLNVYIYWFGDQVVVKPDGSYGIAVRDNGQGVASMNAEVAKLQGKQPYYLSDCPHDDCVNKPQDLIFKLQQPEGSGILGVTSPGTVEAQGTLEKYGIPILLIVVLVLAVLVIRKLF